jgi:hypothetical protein
MEFTEPVIPAIAGIQLFIGGLSEFSKWIPAFAGMTAPGQGLMH